MTSPYQSIHRPPISNLTETFFSVAWSGHLFTDRRRERLGELNSNILLNAL
jgi:hypothetical protein